MQILSPDRRQPAFTILCLHYLVLWNFTIAQPIFDVVQKHATFLTAHHFAATETILFTVLVSLLLPLIILVPVVLLWLLSRMAARLLLGLFLIGLTMAFMLLLMQHFPDLEPGSRITLSLVLALFITLLYWRRLLLPQILTLLSPSILIFPLWFLLTDPVRPLIDLDKPQAVQPAGVATVDAGKKLPPIVLLLFDEFSLNILLDDGGKIDQQAFPNIAAFASTSHWFANASTVSTLTETAVPSLLSSQYPAGDNQDKTPLLQNYPGNLFTYLQYDYDIVALESVTGLCPPAICRNPVDSSLFSKIQIALLDAWIVYQHLIYPPQWRQRLPAIDLTWVNFAKRTTGDGSGFIARFTSSRDKLNSELQALLDSIQPADQPRLYYGHFMLPHAPYVYTPSGKIYAGHRMTGLVKQDNNQDRWINDKAMMQEYQQRYRWQVQYVDRYIGRVIERLQQQQLFDEALIIITSDHGASVQAGSFRRMVSGTNAADIMLVPLFVKTPYQTRARVSRRNVEIIDIVPSIADVLHKPLPWKASGQSVFDEHKAERSF